MSKTIKNIFVESFSKGMNKYYFKMLYLDIENGDFKILYEKDNLLNFLLIIEAIMIVHEERGILDFNILKNLVKIGLSINYNVLGNIDMSSEQIKEINRIIHNLLKNLLHVIYDNKLEKNHKETIILMELREILLKFKKIYML